MPMLQQWAHLAWQVSIPCVSSLPSSHCVGAFALIAVLYDSHLTGVRWNIFKNILICISQTAAVAAHLLSVSWTLVLLLRIPFSSVSTYS